MSQQTVGNTANLEVQSKSDEGRFYGEMPLAMDYPCIVNGLLENHKIVLQSNLEKVQIEFANCAMQDEKWQERNEKLMKCKMIGANILLIGIIEADLAAMMSAS